MVCRVNLEQKEVHEVIGVGGEVISIWLGRRYGENGREVNANVVEVMDVGGGIEGVSVGDFLVLHHNIVVNEALWIRREGSVVWLGVRYDGMVYGRVRGDGGIIPLSGGILVERVDRERGGRFDVLGGTDSNFFRVVEVGGVDFVSVGDIVLCYKHSDYELVYHWGNRERRCIRVNGDDILGIKN